MAERSAEYTIKENNKGGELKTFSVTKKSDGTASIYIGRADSKEILASELISLNKDQLEAVVKVLQSKF